MDGLMKGIIKTGVIFSAVLVAALAVFYVLPAVADATVTSTVNPASVNTRQNVTLNFTITASGNSPLKNISINVTGAGWLGLIAGNIVCPNATDNGQGTPWNASIAGNTQLATCFRNHTTQNLTGTITMAIKGLSANVTGITSNFTITVVDDVDVTNTTTVPVSVLLLEANATLDVSNVNAGAKQNYTFTVANNGTDSSDRINITYDANFADPAAGDVVCPDPGDAGRWTPSVDTSNNIVTCTKGGANLVAGSSATLKVENWSAPNDARVKTFAVNVRGSKGGNFTVVSSMPSVNVFGNMTITGINRASSINQTGTKNITMMKYDFNATGEQMNVTQIIITRNGTVSDSDIIQVKLYNSTDPRAGDSLNDTTTYDLLAMNTSAPSNGRYTFGSLALNVNISQRILVVVNLSSTASGGATMNFSIEGAADVTTTGGHSGQSITETLATTRSSSTTVYGTLSVTGATRVAATTQIGTTNVTVATFNFTATGEQMNISEIIITRNGTNIANADIIEVKLYNTTDPAATTVNSTQTPLAVNTSAPSADGRYNFSGLSLKVPTGTTGQIILVSFNISSSATGGRKFNVSIEGMEDIVTNASVSGAAITETLASARSDNSTIYGTIAVTGAGRAAASTQIGSTNVTVVSFNFTSAGEIINVTGINITFNGTFATSDIVRVALYNSSAANAGVLDGSGVNYDLISWNISAPVISENTMRYNFSNIRFNISAGSTNVLLVVVNLSEAARGGRTFNASIEGAADVVSRGLSSEVSLTETFASQRSTSSTIKGNLSVTGANITPSSVDIGQIGVSFLRLTFNATGENINITSINVTSNNTRNQDVLAVRLFDDLGGSTTATYERGTDLPLAGASGVFGGTSGGSVLITPTVPINVTMNSLHYVYVVLDINTSATAGTDRLGVSIQASAISATGNESVVSLTPELLTGDPGAINVDIKNVTATVVVITTGTNVARSGVGTRNNYTFTVNNTATGVIKDPIDEVRILFGGTGFTLLGNATCPTISSVAWNRTILSANTIVCNVTDSAGYLLANTNTTVLAENFTAGATAGIYQMNISVRGAAGGQFNVTSNPSITSYGNLTVKATNAVNGTVQIGTSRVTFFYMNLSASGEAANVTDILVTLNGTGVAAADIAAVELYNSTDKSTTIVNGSQTLLRANVTSVAPDLTYNFSGLNLSVPTGVTGQIVLVVVNVTSGATGGRTINATVIDNNNMVTVTSLTGINIAENFTSEVNSSTTTIFGNLSVTGASRVSASTRIGSTNVTAISFNFTSTGEAVNVTGLNITINGTGLTTADIVEVRLYNSTSANAGILDATGVNYDLIQRNISEPTITGSSMRFNFSNIVFNISAGGTNTLLVTVNLSRTATGGRTFNVSIQGAEDIISTSVSSGQALTETISAARSVTSTIYGNLTVSGTTRVAAQTRLGSSNVTIISFNLSAAGEQMNISEIIITRNGTVTNEDIVSVALYNSTKDNAQTFNETGNIDPLAVNTSAPTNGRYNFSGLSLKVPTGNIGQIIMVVFNVSSSANAGRTFNASIEGAGDVATVGGNSSVAITEDFATQRSGTSTIVGMKIVGTSRVSTTTEIGATNVSVISFAFNASGESMNITGLNITLNGTITTADIVRVGLYNSTAANAGVYNETTYDLLQWNSSAPVVGADGNSRFNFSNILFNVSSGVTNTLVVVVNLSSTATGGRTFNASIEGDADVIVTGLSSGLAITETYTSQRSSSSTIYGNMTVAGTSRAAANTRLGSTNVTIISYNFSTTGEQMNVSEIIVTLNGTVTTADIVAVKLYNSTKANAQTFNETGNIDPIASNTSAPTAGAGNTLRYNFSGLSFRVPSSQIVMVVVNISSSATGGRTFNASIESAGDIVTNGGGSGASISESLSSQRSGTSMLVSISLTGTSRAPSTAIVGTNNITLISFNVSVLGEQMNISGINITLNGTGLTSAHIARLGLYNSTHPDAGVYNGTNAYTLIAWNNSEPVISENTMRYNFSNLGAFNVSVGSNTLLVVVNLSPSAAGGVTFNASIEGAADVVSTGNGSALDVTETFASQRSSSVTIFGNLSVTATDALASYTRISSNNNNITVLILNFTTTGEQMNVSEIIITRNGTVTDADIVEVKLYNSTLPDTTTFNGSQTPVALNRSPSANRYNFSTLNLSVPTGATGQMVLVVVNVSSSATGGRTLNFSVESASDIVSLGNTSYQSIAETLTGSIRSNTSTLVSISLTGTSRAPSTAIVGTNNITLISFNVSVLGEQMNISGINITLNGTGLTSAHIARLGLYNSTHPDAGVYNGTNAYTLIAWNNSGPVAGAGGTLRYNFSNLGAFNVSVGSNTLLVVVNLSPSAAGGVTFNASIEGAADVVSTGNGSALDVTETFASQRSSSVTIVGNLTVNATDILSSYTRLGSTNVTVLRLNLTAVGEQMNVSEIIITRNGTVTDADIVEVKLYNSTLPDTTTFNGSQTPVALNRSPSANRYNFSTLNLSVPTGATGQMVLVVINTSASTTGAGGRTFNFSVESAGDIVALSNTSYQSIAETLVGAYRANASTLISFNVSANSVAPGTISANQTATAMLNITVAIAGETLNITSFNFTLTGNATEGNVSDVRMYRDEATAPGRFDSSDTYLGRASVIGTSIQVNLTSYNLSGSQTFFVTYNISSVARTLATAGIQFAPSAVAAIGNSSGLAISVTGDTVASTNSTIQSEANLIFGSITSSYPWITNKTNLVNTTNISIPVTNGGAATANLTSVLLTLLSEANAQNASSNFTVVRADSVASIAGGVTTTLNFTINATTAAQLVGRVNASVMLRYNDSNSYAQNTAGPVETNTSGLFGLDGTLPVISILNPAHLGNASGNMVELNFTLNDTGSGINRSAIAISVNNVARNSTCSASQLNFTCNFTLFSSDSLFVFGSITARITNITDNATNSAGAVEINFTLNNNDGVANLTRPIVGADPYALGWNTIQMPTQTMMEQQGRNASNTGDFNFTAMMASLGTSWTHMYYNTNGTSTGWVLATRTDFAGSTLKYINNTNANPYWINMTARGMVFKI